MIESFQAYKIIGTGDAFPYDPNEDARRTATLAQQEIEWLITVSDRLHRLFDETYERLGMQLLPEAIDKSLIEVSRRIALCQLYTPQARHVDDPMIG